MGCGASKVTVAPEVAKASPGGESSAPIASESLYSSPSKNGSSSNEEKGESHGKIQQGIVSHCSEEAGEPCVVLEGSNGHKYRMYENRVLGEGSFSVVREGEVIGTNEAVAVKCVREDKLSARDRDALQDEIRIMHKLQEHPHVVQLREAIRVDDGASGQTLLYLVMEKVQGGELFDRIVQLEAYTELQARQTSVVLLDAMRFLHAQGIAHRDLKPENLLLVSNKNHTNIKIADFGFAAEIGIDPCTGKLGDTLTTTCGTPGYVAPEVITAAKTGGYGLACDMWSVGVIVFVLLGGYAPFEDPDPEELFKAIVAGDFEFHEEYWADVSDAAKDFIRRLLTVERSARITVEEALHHPWLELSESELATRNLGHNQEAMKAWNRKRKFKRAMNTVRATVRMSLLIGGIKKGAAKAAEENEQESSVNDEQQKKNGIQNHEGRREQGK